MASWRGAYGELIRASGRGCKRTSSSRCFHTRPRSQAAHNLTMPAMSPTMTEGNIASWKVKEGDRFATGDVLLEIETDKAQMDVEAQDEGVMAKIIHSDGAKSVKVGSRIAVLAELDDDITKLEMPKDEQPSQSSSSTKNENEKAIPSDSDARLPSNPSGHQKADSTADQHTAGSLHGQNKKAAYPLYPSVSQLLHENGISQLDAKKIRATGPQGRLLKGDVLAYLGAVEASYPLELAARLTELALLDLSNVEMAAPKKPERSPAEPPAVLATQETNTDVAVTVDLRTVQEVRERIQKVLGIDIPVSTFISRASEVSNLNLPPSRAQQPSSDELFDAVLGLHHIRKASFGSFAPQLIALPPTRSPPSRSRPRKADIIDALTTTSPTPSRSTSTSTPSEESDAMNILSLNVPKAEEHRAKVFLERVKTILHIEPGRCVL